MSEIRCISAARTQTNQSAYFAVYFYYLRERAKDKVFTWRKGGRVNSGCGTHGEHITTVYSRACIAAENYAALYEYLTYLPHVRANEELTPLQCEKLGIPVPEYLVPRATQEKLTGKRVT